MKITLPNGLILEGKDSDVAESLVLLGYGHLAKGLYYYSSTKGKILISEMETKHLRNAIRKYLREADDIENEVFRAMVEEYTTREL